jgi:hypothetical protein
VGATQVDKAVWRAIFLGILCLVFVSGETAAAPQGPVSEQTVERVSHGVVPVACFNNGEHTFYIYGTAFFVDKSGRVVTAGHVIESGPRIYAQHGYHCVPGIIVPLSGFPVRLDNARPFYFTECRLPSMNDVTVCRLTSNPFDDPTFSQWIRPLHLRTTPVAVGTFAAITGFEKASHTPITYDTKILQASASTGEGPVILLQSKLAQGTSGGPVYLDDGSVIGVVSRGGGGVLDVPPANIIKLLIDAK